MAAIEAAMVRLPGNVSVLRGAGQIHEAAGETAKALAAYQRVLALGPGDKAAQAAVDRLAGAEPEE